jgi:hypothetical protein
MNSPQGESPWHTFNTRFDELFVEDCRNDQGGLHHIQQGTHGMDLVCIYLGKLDAVASAMPLDLMAIKLEWLSIILIIVNHISFINGFITIYHL